MVDSSDEMQLARAIARGMAEADASARMARQPGRAEWLAVADLVIPNHGDEVDFGDAVPQVIPLSPSEFLSQGPGTLHGCLVSKSSPSSSRPETSPRR